MLFTSSWFVDLILLFVTVAFLVYKYLTRNFDYWKKKGIIYLKPIPFFGNAYDICTFKCNMGPWFKTIYDSVNEPFFGIFILDRPYLVVKSPELIKQMLVNDFNTFSRRVAITPTHNTIVSNMMFFQESVGWRKIRPKMSPTFTSGKLKGMSEIITNIALDMNKYIKNHLGQLDAKEVCAKYSTDVIAGCAFGIRARSFENENADFRKIGKEMFDFSWRNAFCQSLYFLGHPAVNILRLNFFSSWSVKFVVSAFWDTIKLREESEANGQDLIDVVMSMRKNKKLCQELNFEGDKVAAQAVQFFAAGFETTSTTMAFMLYQLCLHPEIQDRLRQEVIDSIKTNNGITYEGIAKMKYLDMCVLGKQIQ
ncbi:hypothetical protein NQ318_003750 [Aromia moschata]|uniref:Cytochrome P450 n=1 Tax=Aromia moschata TaxID=1265417 RepID=A0AAV8YI31_9CUCU|nr:hypothetical protein NQ318_003750 [Aromia moschata]